MMMMMMMMMMDDAHADNAPKLQSMPGAPGDTRQKPNPRASQAHAPPPPSGPPLALQESTSPRSDLHTTPTHLCDNGLQSHQPIDRSVHSALLNHMQQQRFWCGLEQPHLHAESACALQWRGLLLSTGRSVRLGFAFYKKNKHQRTYNVGLSKLGLFGFTCFFVHEISC